MGIGDVLYFVILGICVLLIVKEAVTSRKDMRDE